jgi:hypothetical protein
MNFRGSFDTIRIIHKVQELQPFKFSIICKPDGALLSRIRSWEFIDLGKVIKFQNFQYSIISRHKVILEILFFIVISGKFKILVLPISFEKIKDD